MLFRRNTRKMRSIATGKIPEITLNRKKSVFKKPFIIGNRKFNIKSDIFMALIQSIVLLNTFNQLKINSLIESNLAVC